ncbi:ion channel [Clostridium sp. BSD9I1]|uniref:ion channel n=1 Tax=Clostridium sp. BSD9I1 TaxID=2003589 RepID=UPI001645F530|nr:ion channel [Clostridium sp. BSD9I1]
MAISLLCFCLAYLIDVNIISGVVVNLFCSVLILLLRSYALFYVSLAATLIISYRYYNKRKKIGSNELVSIFALNLINIAISSYILFRIVYYYPIKFFMQKYIIFTNIVLIEDAPIAYMIMIYMVIIILILSINNHMSIQYKNNVQLTIMKTSVTFISIVLLIIVANAIVYFIIHNFPSSQLNGIFDGNFLKDPIKYYYRVAKPFSDCLWFSATTFFTVGYGDMHPVGNIMYFTSIMEMISAYILGIIIIPILLFKVSSK